MLRPPCPPPRCGSEPNPSYLRLPKVLLTLYFILSSQKYVWLAPKTFGFCHQGDSPESPAKFEHQFAEGFGGTPEGSPWCRKPKGFGANLYFWKWSKGLKFLKRASIYVVQGFRVNGACWNILSTPAGKRESLYEWKVSYSNLKLLDPWCCSYPPIIIN